MSLTFRPGQLLQRAALYHQLGQLTAAGIPLLQALATQQRQRANRAAAAPLAAILHQLNEGATFSQALESVPGWMPAFDVALLHAAEKSGRLPATFQLLASHYQDRARLARQLMAYLAYPAFLFHLGCLIFPVARLQQLVLQGDWIGYLGQKLAVFLPLYAGVGLVILALQGHRGESWRALIETLLRAIPGLGSARRQLALARLAAALQALLSAGISILEAWPLAAAASGSPALRRAVQRAQPRLEAGQTPAEIVRDDPEFPPHFASQYQTGEVSGQLEASLERLHQHYQQEGFRNLKGFLVLSAAVIIGLVMLAAAWQILSFWLRYFQQIQDVLPP